MPARRRDKSAAPLQDFQPLPHSPKSVVVMRGGELVDNLRKTLKQLVPKGPILYTFTAYLPGVDCKTLLYLGQSGQGLSRMLDYIQEADDYFGDKDDSFKHACMMSLAARGFTIEVQYVHSQCSHAVYMTCSVYYWVTHAYPR